MKEMINVPDEMANLITQATEEIAYAQNEAGETEVTITFKDDQTEEEREAIKAYIFTLASIINKYE